MSLRGSLSSIGSTQHVCNWDEKWAVVCRVVDDGFIEKLCYITFGYDTELTSSAETGSNKTYMLPDGNIITGGAGRFHCAEVLYQTSFIGKEAFAFHDTSFVSFMKYDADVRKNLYALSQCRVNR